MIRHLPVDFFWLAAVETLAVLIGLKIFHYSVDFKSELLKLLASFGLGLAVISCSVLMLAHFNLLYRWVFLVFFGIVFILVSGQIRPLLAILKNLKDRLAAQNFSGFDKLLLLLLAAAVLSDFIFAFTPATQARELHYNLAMPKLLLRQGGLIGHFDEHAKHFPFLLENVYTLALSLAGPVLAKLIHYSLGVFSCVLVFHLARTFVGVSAGVPAAVFFYLMPLVTSVSGTANVELGTLYFGLLSVCFLLLWMEGKDSIVCAALAGLMAGFSWQSKITGLAMVPAGLAFIIAMGGLNKPSFIPALKTAVLFGCFAALGCSPWLLKNIYYSGNPLFPFPVDFLGWKGQEYAVLEIARQAAFRANFSFWEVLKLHNNVLMGDILFGPGPLVFAFAVPGILLNRSRNSWALLSLSALLFAFHNILFNTYFHRFFDTRFYILMYSLLCILAAKGWVDLKTHFKPVLLNGMVLAGLVVPGFLLSLVFGVTKIPVFIGRESEEQFLERKLVNHSLVKAINEIVSPNSKIVYLGTDPQWFYMDAQAVLPPVYMHRLEDPEEVVEGLRKIRATHVLIFEGMFKRKDGDNILHHPGFSEMDLYWNLERLKATYFREVYRNDKAVLYEVSYLDNSNKV
ncbi:MAG: hypothetical protein A2901_08110 [Elusimicrobia bacterium RIFCSPLOWO2_01_FULL_54_10]|nr:MAG: hypothetical protein A2901_08110 [Elusimicrobia bacterium RIFCSPLOWO2_01_FULL_54_10]